MFLEITIWFLIIVIIGVIASRPSEEEVGAIVILTVFYLLLLVSIGPYGSTKTLINEDKSVEEITLYSLSYNEDETSETNSSGMFLFLFGSYDSSTKTYITEEYQYMVENENGWIQSHSLEINKDNISNIYYKEDDSVEPTYIIETTTREYCRIVEKVPKGFLAGLFFKKEVGECLSDDYTTEIDIEHYFIVPKGSIERDYNVN